MKPPENSKVIEFPASTIWFDESGILCSVSKKVPPQTMEETKKTTEEFINLIGGKKICLLTDSTYSNPPNKEIRDYLAAVIPEIVKAVAVISRSAVGKMTANLFFSINKQPYPVKLFTDESKAKEWLRQYL